MPSNNHFSSSIVNHPLLCLCAVSSAEANKLCCWVRENSNFTGNGAFNPSGRSRLKNQISHVDHHLRCGPKCSVNEKAIVKRKIDKQVSIVGYQSEYQGIPYRFT